MEEFEQDQSTIKAGNGKEKENYRDQATSNKDAGDDLDLDGEAHQSIYLDSGKHDPCCAPCTFDANHAHGSNLTATVRGAAKQIESEPVTTNTAFTEAQRLFFADELFSAGLQDYNPNGIFGSLKSTFLPMAAPLQSRGQELEGRSMPGDHVDSPLKPAIMIRASLGNRKDSDASELVESMVNTRTLLMKEHCEAHPRVSPSSTVQNFDNNGIDLNSIFRRSEIDMDEFRQCQGKDENLYELEEEVLMKTMGWFPVEEYPNENSDTTLSLHWILDEQPSASDLPHLESLMEISPSKFWSPNSESSKRPPVQFGYLNLSDSPQSSHSIQYFLNDSPTSSPEVGRTIFGGASGVRISSKEANRQCSRACRNIHGTTQIIRTPMSANGESREKTMTSLSSGADRKFGAQVQGVPEKSPALSDDNPMKYASREEHKTAPVQKDHTNHQEIWSVASLTSSDKDARRLQLLQSGKNLVINFLDVGRTQENVEARQVTNDIPLKDTIQPLWTQNENTLDQTRRQCMTEISTKERESTSPPLELQAIRRADGNFVTKRESDSDQNRTRIRDVPLLPHSDIPYPSNLATSLRNALHEKLESQLLYRKPLFESHKNEGFVTLRCPKPTPNNFSWSSPAVPRVSRKRSSRITTPKITRVDVLNLFGNGKIPQSLRTTPDKDLYTCKRRKTTRKNTFGELRTSQRNVKLQSPPASACEIDTREIDTRDMGMKEGTRSQKSPILTRIINPLRLIATSPAKGYTCVGRKWTLRSTVKKELPTDPRNVNANQVTKHAPIKHLGDVSEAVVSAEMNPGSSGSTTYIHKVKEGSLRTSPVGSEMSDIGPLRSSKYRGVTRHRHTGRYEAHLWDNTKVKLGLAKRGRQVYLGAYPNEDQAAQAHDLAALKYWGPNVYTNFPPTLYEEELKTMKSLTKEEYIVILRRRSPGFTRGISKYRGVTRHHQEGRWEARIGRHSGAKYHYLGTYDTQEEAAAAYDRAAVRHRGVNAITNFDLSNYIKTKSKANRSVSPTSSPSGQS